MPLANRYRLAFFGGGQNQPTLGLGSHLETAMALARDWHSATHCTFMAIVDCAPERPEAGEKGHIIGYRYDVFQQEFKPIREERRCGWTSNAAILAVENHLADDIAATRCRPHRQPLVQRNVLARRKAVSA